MVEENEVEAGDWSFTGIWNKSLEEPGEQRPVEPRDYLWASEIGKSEIDVFLRLQGTLPTNPPNPRSLRKFEAGNLWEWIVMTILMRAGILQDSQVRVEHQYDGLMRVSGKIDFVAGGKIDVDAGMNALKAMNLPPNTARAIENILKYLSEFYPNGLRSKALEIKSCSSFVMNAMEITEKPLDGHALQAYHYTKKDDIDRTDLIYICRDDCRMMEFPILKDSIIWEEKYRRYIEKMTEIYRSGVRPEKSPPIIFDETLGKFSINRQIGWSGYLTLIYGFESQMEFEETYAKIPAPWNRVLKRIKTRKEREKWLSANGVTDKDILKEKAEGKKTATVQYIIRGEEKIYVPEHLRNGFEMTPKNLEAITQMKEYGWDAEECADKLVVTSDDEEVEEAE